MISSRTLTVVFGRGKHVAYILKVRSGPKT
jgi:hypothetical protein